MTPDGKAAGASLLFCLVLAALQVWHAQQTTELRSRLDSHQRRLLAMQETLDTLHAASAISVRRRRSVDAASASVQTSPDGIPIVDRPYSYRSAPQESRPALRVYDTFDATTAAPETRTTPTTKLHRGGGTFQGGQLGRVNIDPTPAPDPVTSPQHRKSRVKQDDTKDAETHAKPMFLRGRRRRLHGKRRHLKAAAAKRLKEKRSKLREKSRQTAEARSAPLGFTSGPSGQEAASQTGWPSRLDSSQSSWSSSQDASQGGWGSSQDSPQGGWASSAGRHASATASSSGRHLDPDEDEWSGSDGGTSERRTSSGSHRRGGRRVQRLMEELRNTLGTTAAHLEGHTTAYSLDHPHYNGNGILRNARADARFADWRFAPWVYTLGYSNDFVLHAGGELTVKKPGVYYLYAQINYLDPGDINGFELMVNGISFAKCLTMESTNHRQKVNTCHTSGVTYLDTGDSVSIRDIERMRISMLLPDRSFFGLVRLAGTGGAGDVQRRRRRRRRGHEQHPGQA